MNVLVACPIKDRAWAVPYWIQGIRDNEVPGVNLHPLVLLSPSEDDSLAICLENEIEVIHDSEPGRPVQEIKDHLWGNIAKYEYMSRLRNTLVELAQERDFDYFFSLDSDIVLPKYGMGNLLHYARTHPGITSPSVNMVANGVAWNVMNWTSPYHPMMANRTKIPKEGRADVIMAAMLLDREALECRWAAHMAGEDIGFCLDAESRGICRWWYPEVRCQHLMSRP